MEARKSGYVLWLIPLLMLLSFTSHAVTFRTVYQEGFPSKFNSENPDRPGICLEVLRAVERIDPEVKFIGLEKRATTARILSMLDNREIDVFFGLARTPDRENKYIWIGKIFSAQAYLFVLRSESQEFTRMEQIQQLTQNNTILVIPKTAQDEYMKKIPGIQIDRGAQDTEQNLNKLVKGRGRFYFGSDSNTMPVISRMGLLLQVKTLPILFPANDNYLAAAQGVDPVALLRLRNAMEVLNSSGELQRIFNNYLK